MKKSYFLIIFFIFFILQGCKTVSTKVDKTISQEEQKLSQFLNKTVEELKIEFGEPDIIETTDKKNKHFVYLRSKLKIKCERIFEIDQNDLVIGFTSKNWF